MSLVPLFIGVVGSRAGPIGVTAPEGSALVLLFLRRPARCRPAGGGAVIGSGRVPGSTRVRRRRESGQRLGRRDRLRLRPAVPVSGSRRLVLRLRGRGAGVLRLGTRVLGLRRLRLRRLGRTRVLRLPVVAVLRPTVGAVRVRLVLRLLVLRLRLRRRSQAANCSVP